MGSEVPVESVRRAFELLEELNRQRVNSIHHLHRATALPKSTIVRLLETLSALGYVVNDRRQGGYQVTSQVHSLSCGFHADPLVVEAGRPWAIEFTRRQQWPVALAVLDRDAVVVRFSTIADSPVSPFHATLNMRLQLLTRALGRAYLAFCPASERDLILEFLEASADPEDAAAQDRPSVLTMLARVRAAGFAERSLLVEPKSSSTLAVPIMRGTAVLATLGMTYFTSAMPKAQAIGRYVPLLKELAKNIQKSVGAVERRAAGVQETVQADGDLHPPR
jgi:IclR family transcriptional regulator, mhp operon transcriptional activator